MCWDILRLDIASPPDPYINIRYINAVVTAFELVFDDDGTMMEQKTGLTYPMWLPY